MSIVPCNSLSVAMLEVFLFLYNSLKGKRILYNHYQGISR